jgi:hypothetical protein
MPAIVAMRWGAMAVAGAVAEVVAAAITASALALGATADKFLEEFILKQAKITTAANTVESASPIRDNFFIWYLYKY